jgi:uncharacterized membrane protein AbrB (regulator of aidB expression)
VLNDDRADWREAWALFSGDVAYVWHGALHAATVAESLEAFLAFAPAGQAEMTLLAIVVGADLGYVVLHHLTRIVLVITGAPIAARLMGHKPRKP